MDCMVTGISVFYGMGTNRLSLRKRRHHVLAPYTEIEVLCTYNWSLAAAIEMQERAVSYTHLTLPTKA